LPQKSSPFFGELTYKQTREGGFEANLRTRVVFCFGRVSGVFCDVVPHGECTRFVRNHDPNASGAFPDHSGGASSPRDLASLLDYPSLSRLNAYVYFSTWEVKQAIVFLRNSPSLLT
jgi:hypothetical protein